VIRFRRRFDIYPTTWPT